MKTILITGSTDGIGKLAAIKFAKAGCQVLLHGRSSEKLEQTIAEVKQLSNNEQVAGFLSDLSDFESIQTMMRQIADNYTHIDVLINNAGVFNSKIQLNKNGLDMRLTVNYLASYLLTYGLLPLLQKSKAPRLLNLSSAAQAPVSLQVLKGTEQVSAQSAYAQSKLALTMWSFDFAKNNPTITTIAVNPGSLLNTRMVQEAFGRSWGPADKGADILYDLALEEVYANNSGQYFDNDVGAFNRAHADAYNPERIAQLVSETEKILHAQ